MISQICSLYWGGSPLSYLQYLTIVSFKKHNPEWMVRLFVPKDGGLNAPTWRTPEQQEAYNGKDWLAEAKKLCEVETVDFKEFGVVKELHEVQKSDIIRYYILYLYGGVWSDMDILYTKPINHLLETPFDFTFSYHETPFIGFYVTKKGQQVFNDLFIDAVDLVRRNMNDNYQSLGAERLEARYRSLEGIAKSYPGSLILNLPMDVVYPYLPNADIKELFYGTIDKMTPQTIGIHWYNGSPIAKDYQNNFNEHQHNNSTISKLIKEYGGV